MKVIAKFSFSRRALGLSLSVAVSMALLFVLFATEDAERTHAQTGTSTPSPTSTLSPSPEPTDSCLTSLSSDGTVDGNWNDDCESEGRSDSYASYYSFTLTESAEVTITTESSVDTYLFLRQGSGRSGSELCNNDDYGSEVSGDLCQSIESTLESEYDWDWSRALMPAATPLRSRRTRLVRPARSR